MSGDAQRFRRWTCAPFIELFTIIDDFRFSRIDESLLAEIMFRFEEAYWRVMP